MDAELLSIAGCYLTSENSPALDRACQVYLQQDHLCIDPI